MKTKFLLVVPIILMSGCFEDDQATLPPAQSMTADALGHYCQMMLIEHPGPKGQIHLTGRQYPIFFSQVRDAIAYERMPEQSSEIAAVYVSDMGAAKSWNEPGEDNWILASEAYFVAGSHAIGGMGAPELVPFSERSAAVAFVERKGGRIVKLDDVMDEDVLGPTSPAVVHEENHQYQERLESLSEEKGS